jgi:hypothetical protein
MDWILQLWLQSSSKLLWNALMNLRVSYAVGIVDHLNYCQLLRRILRHGLHKLFALLYVAEWKIRFGMMS